MGKGIKPEFPPHVFDRFRQADSSTTRQYDGLGLGLAIVKHPVELHGGSVRARSGGEEQGETFVVTLPLPIVPLDEKDPGRTHPSAQPDRAAEFDVTDRFPFWPSNCGAGRPAR